jgi:hypothetical protein
LSEGERLSVQAALLDGGGALRLEVKQAGWVSLTASALAAAGLAANVDPRKLRLWTMGQEVPLKVVGGEDGVFAGSDALWFYADGLDTEWSGTRVYYVTLGPEDGLRLGEPGALGQDPATASTTHRGRFHAAYRQVYYAAVQNGEAQNFFGAAISAAKAREVLLPAADRVAGSGEKAILTVSLQTINPLSHRAKLSLNGVALEEVTIADQAHRTLSYELDPSLLLAGDNVLKVESLGVESALMALDEVELRYEREARAKGELFEGFVEGGAAVRVRGFSSTALMALDLTCAEQPQALPVEVEQAGGEIWAVVAPSGSGERRVLIQPSAKATGAVTLQGAPATGSLSTAEGAELVIVTPSAFEAALAPLVALRQAQGLTLKVVTTEAIYERYGYGHKSPWAIRQLVAEATSTWTKKTRYLLLAGDASFDSRDRLGQGDLDLVPTKLLDTQVLTVASDEWYVDPQETGTGEVAVGRLPARTAAELSVMVQKLVSYEAADASGTWSTKAVLVSDVGDDYPFGEVSAQLAELLPRELEVETIDRGESGEAKGRLTQVLREGSLLVNYVGHGSTELWRSNLLTGQEALGLDNGAKLPLVVGMTCLNGMFHDLYTESLAETLMRAEQGGAIGVFASSGVTRPRHQALLNLELYRQLFDGAGRTLGEAVQRAKALFVDERSADAQDVRRSWILFGDPSLRLKGLAAPAKAAEVPGPADTVPAPDPRGCALATDGASVKLVLFFLLLGIGRAIGRRWFSPRP